MPQVRVDFVQLPFVPPVTFQTPVDQLWDPNRKPRTYMAASRTHTVYTAFLPGIFWETVRIYQWGYWLLISGNKSGCILLEPNAKFWHIDICAGHDQIIFVVQNLW